MLLLFSARVKHIEFVDVMPFVMAIHANLIRNCKIIELRVLHYVIRIWVFDIFKAKTSTNISDFEISDLSIQP